MTTSVTEGNDTQLPDHSTEENIRRTTFHRPDPRLVTAITARDQP